MRAAPIKPETLDVIAAVLATSRRTFVPKPAEAIIQDYYEIRDLLNEQEIRRLPGYSQD